MTAIVLICTLMTALETIQAFMPDNYTAEEYKIMDDIRSATNFSNATVRFLTSRQPVCAVIETICYSFLTLEIILCISFSPRRSELLRCWMHIAEMICYISYWLSLITWYYMSENQSVHVIRLHVALKFLTALLLVRLFRISRQIPAFNILGLTFRTSTKELAILGIMLSILTVTFGCIMHIAESLHHETFDNAFTAMYWALITLTTVGYGDYTPSSPVGHVIAGVCGVMGVLMLALPVGVIASSFNDFYSHDHYVKRHIQCSQGKKTENGKIKL